MPFAIMYPFSDGGWAGGPGLPLHTKQPLLSHIDRSAEDAGVLPQERAGERRGLHPALFQRPGLAPSGMRGSGAHLSGGPVGGTCS